MRKMQDGFGAIAAIVVLVMLGALAAAIMKFSWGQQMASAQDVLSAKAWLAARAGNEWGLYQALQTSNWSACSNASQTLLPADVGSEFTVTVTCDSASYTEGIATVRVYTLEATACNMPSSGACPNSSTAVASPGYVERRQRIVATN